MKRIFCMVLAGTMVLSMMPTEAFAKGDISAVAKVVGAMELTKAEVEKNNCIINRALGGVPELQLKVRDVAYKHAGTDIIPEETEITVSLQNAAFITGQELEKLIYVVDDDQTPVISEGESIKERLAVSVKAEDVEDDTVTFTFNGNFEEDDIIVIQLQSVMDSISEGRTAAVSVESDMVSTDALTYVTVVGKTLKANIRKMETVAAEETAKITSSGLKIEAAAGTLPEELKLRLSKGFAFEIGSDVLTGEGYTIENVEEDELTVKVAEGRKGINLKGIEIEAVTAETGDIASIRITAKNYNTVSVDVMEVVDYKVELSVDEDEDIPLIYSGVGVDNYGLTDDSEHLSLEITVEESYPGAWNMKKAFAFRLPEGVYVAKENENGISGVEVTGVEGLYLNGKAASTADVVETFRKAYQKGDYLEFEFKRKAFDDVKDQKKTAKLTFALTLVADPDFEGEVDLTLTGDEIEEQTVTIAEFAKPYTVQAEQNEMKIDYRHTEVPSSIVVTEAEAGLWAAKDAVFAFQLEKGDLMQFEKDADFQVNTGSEMKLNTVSAKKKGSLAFQVKEKSEDEAAMVTISDMELYLPRDIANGYYDLLLETSMEYGDSMAGFSGQHKGTGYLETELFGGTSKEKYISDVADYDTVVKEGFIHIITPGRDEEGFTTKVVVPVGKDHIVAGEKKIELDVPAYINKDGYTMLPVRAVAKALGLNDNEVLWDQPSKTVTILHGQRIISMTLGQKYVTVNGSRLPASAEVEITNGRTFLPMRDLATALGVTDIAWDNVTKTATLNGNK